MRLRFVAPTRHSSVPAITVFAGGLVGSGARELAAALLNADARPFPAAVLTVNLLGAFALGWLLSRRERSVSGGWSTRFWGIGVLGSFTTFSAFSHDTLRLLWMDRPASALVYSTVSVFGGLAVAHLGQRIGAMR